MRTLKFPKVPDSFYDNLRYPKEGKCSDVVVISQSEADALYEAAGECFQLVDKATEYAIEHNLLPELGIPEYAAPIIRKTFYEFERHPHMVGRFDFAGGMEGLPIKMLEFNADTPFSIVEVSTIQYAVAKFYGLDPDNWQYNTLFEALQEFFQYLESKHPNMSTTFVNAQDGEDDLNTQIIQEAALQAGVEGVYLHWTDLCIDTDHGPCTVSADGLYLDKIFNTIVKMVPWDLLFIEDENMARELIKAMEKDPDLVVSNPPYAAVYQSKGLMALMHQLFPDHPYLLRASREPLQGVPAYVTKPIWGREGCNITMYDAAGEQVKTQGFYDKQPLLYQEKAELLYDGGFFYQAGVFVSMGEPCGIGFRRSPFPIIVTDDELCGHIVDHEGVPK